MLHVTPPMSPPPAIKNCLDLANEAGFVDVNKSTLQSVKFPNVFAIGDCSSSPNSKTAAAAGIEFIIIKITIINFDISAAQSPVVFKNMQAAFAGKALEGSYNGYASCPLITGYDKCILAEFDYDLKPLETFPFSQDKEMYSMYLLKKSVMPSLYWKLMLNGLWNGPAAVRNLLHLGMSK